MERPSPERPRVSIVVPAWNEAASIEACLAAIQGQDYPADRLEIIVVDGASTDDTADRVRAAMRHDPRIRLLSNPARVTPLGFNAGIRAARGSIVGVMSAHAVPAPDYVRRAVDLLASTSAWCVGGRIARTGTSPVQRAIALATSSPFGVGDAAHNYATVGRWVETAFPGLWPRWVFERVGLFDPELVRNQDDELSFRIREAGGRIWYDPALVIEYAPRASFPRLFSQYRQYAMWKVRVFQKHPRAARPRQLVPPAWVAVLGTGVLLAPLGIAGPLAAAGAAVSYAVVMAWGVMKTPTAGTSRVRVLAALVTVHVAYGVGFWQGLVRFAPRWIRDRRGAHERLEVATS